MNFKLNSSSVMVNPNGEIKKVSTNQDLINDVKIVLLGGKPSKRFKRTIATNRKRGYAKRYYIVNQNAQIINFANPFEKLKEASKFASENINEHNTVLYIVPMKIVVEGDKFAQRLELLTRKNNAAKYGLIAE